jgi:hypothetical protein
MTTHSHPSSSVPPCIRALFVAYPREFRREFATELMQVIRDQRSALAGATEKRRALFWIGVIADLLRSAGRERVASVREWIHRRDPRRQRLRLYALGGATLLLGAAGNIAVDLVSPKLSMGIAAMALTTVSVCMGVALLRTARRLTRHS